MKDNIDQEYLIVEKENPCWKLFFSLENADKILEALGFVFFLFFSIFEY